MNRSTTTMFRLALACGLALLLAVGLLLGLGSLSAARARPLQLTYLVTNSNDSGPGSLRQAILEANTQPGADTIQISASGVISLVSPLPVISETVTIQGPGAEQLAVDGGSSFRVFDISAAPVSISGLTVQHGNAGSGQGGGIFSASALTLTNVAVLSSTAQSAGGGVYAAGGLHLTGGAIRNNRSLNGVGGGVRACCTVTILDTQLISNTSANDGGGASLLGTVTISNALFQENHCVAGLCDGGGLFSFSQTTITNTQFISNTARDHGGGAYAPGNLVVSSGLFQGNQALTGGAGGLYGQDQAALQNTHILNNTAHANGGGMYMLGSATISYSLFQGNVSTSGAGGGLAASAAEVSSTQFLANFALEGGGFYHTLYDASLANSLFASNEAASGAGSALLLAAPGTVSILHTTLPGSGGIGATAIEVLTGTVHITNSIITSHTIAISGTGSVYLDYNLFSGNGSDFYGAVTLGPNNLTGNPDFIHPAGMDFHLGPVSAALDRGTAAGLATDFDGDPRPLDGAFDIGFDEASYISGLAISYTPVPVEAGMAATFTGSVATGSGAAYTWDFGDGSPTAAGSPIEHGYQSPGLYTVTLTATNPWGSAIQSEQIEVLPPQWKLYLALLKR